MLRWFKGPVDEDNLGCDYYAGAGNQDAYWAADTNSNRCKLVKKPQKFSVYNEDDYKRCVCEAWGQGEDTCIQEINYLC